MTNWARRREGACAVTLLVALSSPAVAHPLDVAVLEVRLDGPDFRVHLDIGVPLAIDLVHLPAESQNPRAIEAAAPQLARTLLQSGILEADGASCDWQADSQASVEGLRIKLEESARCPHPPAQLRWTLPFLDDAPLTARVLGKAVVEGRESQLLLEPGRQTVALEGVPPRAVGDFIALGLGYLGTIPQAWWASGHRLRLPEGLDHLFFLLALLLAGGPLSKRLLAVATFALSQSVAFGLANSAQRHPSLRLATSALALALILVAAEDALAEVGRHRRALAGVLGLLYGLALASAWARANAWASPAYGFFLGVELGQMGWLLAAGAVLELARRRPALELWVRRGASLALLGAGAFELAYRVGG